MDSLLELELVQQVRDIDGRLNKIEHRDHIDTKTDIHLGDDLYLDSASAHIYFGDGAGGFDTELHRTWAHGLRTEDSLVVAGSFYFGANDSKLYFGASSDVNLYRWGANYLITDNHLVVGGGGTGGRNLYIYSGQLIFGANDGATWDTSLYRAGANLLQTDDVFVAGSTLVIIGELNLWTAGSKLNFGNSAGGYDTNLYRNAANELRTDDAFTAGGNFASVAGSIYLRAAGVKLYFGNSDDTYDTNLYRSAANTLQTDDKFRVADTFYADYNMVVAGDHYISAAGKAIYFGDGAGGYDVALYRSSTDQLTIASGLVVATYVYVNGLAGSGDRHVYVDTDGKLKAGLSYP